jgi:hypothetical protein
VFLKDYLFIPTSLRRRPAAERVVASIEDAIGSPLPHDYRSFLEFTNGVCGPVGRDGYIDVFSIESAVAITVSLELPSFLADAFVIGSDGGGEALCLLSKPLGDDVFTFAFIGTASRADVRRVGASISEVLKLALIDKLYLPPR